MKAGKKCTDIIPGVLLTEEARRSEAEKERLLEADYETALAAEQLRQLTALILLGVSVKVLDDRINGFAELMLNFAHTCP